METPFFSLFFFVFKRIPLVESDPNFMGGDRSEFRPIVSENINFSYHLFARGREKERERERFGRKNCWCVLPKCVKVSRKTTESFY